MPKEKKKMQWHTVKMDARKLEFVAGKHVQDPKDEKAIYVFTYLKGKRELKRPQHIGCIKTNPRTKVIRFYPCRKVSFHIDTMHAIWAFMEELRLGRIIFDVKNGDLYTL